MHCLLYIISLLLCIMLLCTLWNFPYNYSQPCTSYSILDIYLSQLSRLNFLPSLFAIAHFFLYSLLSVGNLDWSHFLYASDLSFILFAMLSFPSYLFFLFTNTSSATFKIVSFYSLHSSSTFKLTAIWSAYCFNLSE